MLVVTRKIGETIVLPECGVRITVVRTNKGAARIGIQAPDHITVLREEVEPQPMKEKDSE